jgi:hypothetical protein
MEETLPEVRDGRTLPVERRRFSAFSEMFQQSRPAVNDISVREGER